jgi:methionyl-tRNA formyltransferase
MGNAVLRSLSEAGIPPTLLVTRDEAGPFPYYREQFIGDTASELGIDCLIGEEGERLASAEHFDIILIATYHRILRPALLSTAKYAVNLHPSLLPQYRGPNPFFWVIFNGEAKTGLTAHGVTAEIDAGPIHWQREISIGENETQGTLRQRTAKLAADAAVDVIKAVRSGNLTCHPKDSGTASAYPRPSEQDRIVGLELDLETIARRIRALSPFPGAIIAGKKVSGIVSLSHKPDGDPTQSRVTEVDGTLRLERGDRRLTLRLSD